jgi:TPP-dependent trihydroxycyclohexane-1,2-dione (THcHDO) dehydratase
MAVDSDARAAISALAGQIRTLRAEVSHLKQENDRAADAWRELARKIESEERAQERSTS